MGSKDLKCDMIDEIYYVGVGGFGIVSLWIENGIAMKDYDFFEDVKDVLERFRSSWVECLEDIYTLVLAKARMNPLQKKTL